MSQEKQHNLEKTAKALSQLVMTMRDPENFAGRFSAVVNLIAQTPGIRAFLSDPAVSADGKDAALQELFDSAGADVCHLVLMLVECGLLNELQTLRDKIVSEMALTSRRLTGEVVSAVPLNDERLQQIRNEVVRITGQEVLLNARVDKGMMGGIRIQVGDMIIDGSIDYQMDQMQQVLLGGDA